MTEVVSGFARGRQHERGFSPRGGGFASRGGGFAPVRPAAFFDARSAGDVRECLEVTPANLVHYEDDGAEARDPIGGLVLSPVGGASRVDVALGRAARVAHSSAQYWSSAELTDSNFGTRSWAIAGVMTCPTAPASELFTWFCSEAGVAGVGVAINALAEFQFVVFEPTTRRVSIAVAHTGVRFGFIVGRHVGLSRMFAQTTLGSGELALGAIANLNMSARMAMPGRHQVDAGAANCTGTDLEAWIRCFDGAAENLLENRAERVGRLTS